MSLVQMSTSSTERIVRQLEVKLDRLSDIVSNGGTSSSLTPSRRRRGGANDGASGPELLSQIGDLLTNGEEASNQVEALQEKVSIYYLNNQCIRCLCLCENDASNVNNINCFFL